MNYPELLDMTTLHLHTDYSNLRLIDSIISVENAIKASIAKGLKGVAITDHEALSGHVKALKTLKELQEKQECPEDFKVLLGNEIYLISDRENYQGKYFHFLLIAKDEIGYQQLKQLSAIAWENSYTSKGMTRVPTLYSDLYDVVSQNKGHLIASTACLGSYFAQEALEYSKTQNMQNKQNIHDFVSYMLDLFGEDFYIEIQPGQEEQIEYNQMAVRIAKAYDIKWIVTTDAHYIAKEDKTVHEAFLKSKEEERETGDFYATTYIFTASELCENMSYLNEDIVIAINNTMDIYNKCNIIDLEQDIKIPERPDNINVQVQHLFRDYYDKYNCKYIELFSNSEYQHDIFLMYQIENGFLKKQEEFNQKNIERINIELEEIWEISAKLHERMSSYYSFTEYIVNEIMWKDDRGNSLVGPARGSVTGFYICYLIEITQVNPLKYNLPHWRHLSKSRPELPKI